MTVSARAPLPPPSPNSAAAAKLPRLGRYQLLEKLGAGGMATVYVAKDIKLDRPVAVKILSTRYAENAAYVERFLREARSAAALDHPNIVRALDVDQEGKYLYFVMEYVEGETLLDILRRRGRLTEKEALDIGIQVAQALEHAAGKSIIHRDIKPDNIMLTLDGKAKVTDLGLAKATDDPGATVTHAGRTIMTAHYASPEQIRGDSDLDARTDIYSLGITLYHLVTGAPPFNGSSTGEVCAKHLENPLPDPKAACPDLSTEFCKILRKMAAKDRNDRYRTAAEAAAELGVLKQRMTATKEAAGALHPASGEKSQRSLSRKSSRLEKKSITGPVIGGLAAVLLLGAGIWFFVSQNRTVNDSKGPTEALSAPRDQPSSTVNATVEVGTEKTEEKQGKNAPAAVSGAGGADGGKGVLQEAEEYSKEHPQDYGEILIRYRAVLEGKGGTPEGMAARQKVNEWQEKWENEANEELQRRKREAGDEVQAGRFDKAMKLLEDFPPPLLTDSVRDLIEAEKRSLITQADQKADEFGAKVSPLVAKEPEKWNAEDIQKVKEMLLEGKALESSMSGGGDKIRLWLKRLEETIEAREEALVEERDKTIQAFWDRYVALVRDRKFEEAVKLIKENQGLLEEAKAMQLVSDIEVLRGLFSGAEKNFHKLAGQIVRLGGTNLKVSEVRDRKLIVKEGQAEMAFGPERLDPEKLLELGLSGEEDRAKKALGKALYEFCYGQPEKAREAMARARASGANTDFYDERLVRVLAEREAGKLVAEIESLVGRERLDEAEEKLEEMGKNYGKTSIARKNMEKLRQRIEGVSPESGGAGGLVAYWNFDEASGTKVLDESGNRCHGTCVNRPAFSNNVPLLKFKNSRSLSLDGVDEYVRVEDHPNLNFTHSLTIALWIKPASFQKFQTIVSKGDPRPQGDGILNFGLQLVTEAPGYVRFFSHADQYVYQDSDTKLNLGEWNHLAVTFDRGKCSFFINGEPAGTGSYASTSLPPSRHPFYIGVQMHLQTGESQYYDGLLDDLRIYDKALPMKEIEALAEGKSSRAPAPKPSTSGLPKSKSQVGDNLLIGYWKFDEVSGTTAEDSSGNRLHGTYLHDPILSKETAPVKFLNKRSLSLDGENDYVEIPDARMLDLSSTMTVSFWTKPSSVAPDQAMVAKWHYPSQASWAIQTGQSNGDGQILVFIAESLTDGGSAGAETVSAPLKSDAYHHVAVVYNGKGEENADRLKVYVNSVEQDVLFRGVIPRVLQDTEATLKVGMFGGSLSRHFRGLIDDLKIFSRVLRPDEIKVLASGR